MPDIPPSEVFLNFPGSVLLCAQNALHMLLFQHSHVVGTDTDLPRTYLLNLDIFVCSTA